MGAGDLQEEVEKSETGEEEKEENRGGVGRKEEKEEKILQNDQHSSEGVGHTSKTKNCFAGLGFEGMRTGKFTVQEQWVCVCAVVYMLLNSMVEVGETGLAGPAE